MGPTARWVSPMDMHQHHNMRTEHRPSVTWGTAAQATLHCLTGCAIGEVLGW